MRRSQADHVERAAGGAHADRHRTADGERCGTRFGAKLGEASDRRASGARQTNSDLHLGVATFPNGGHEKAPRDGTIRKVRLILLRGRQLQGRSARDRSGDLKTKINVARATS